MAPRKGTTNNPKGRPVGVLNKATKGMRERVNAFLDETFEEVVQDFKKLESKDKLLFYTKLLSFGLPTLKAVEHSGEIKGQLDKLSDDQLNELIQTVLAKVDE